MKIKTASRPDGRFDTWRNSSDRKNVRIVSRDMMEQIQDMRADGEYVAHSTVVR